jgi:methanogenic corrinoid protein MtbC1
MSQDTEKATSEEIASTEIIKRMAKAIWEIKQRNENCLPQDLNDVGFTPEQVVKFWDKARERMEINKRLEDWED